MIFLARRRVVGLAPVWQQPLATAQHHHRVRDHLRHWPVPHPWLALCQDGARGLPAHSAEPAVVSEQVRAGLADLHNSHLDVAAGEMTGTENTLRVTLVGPGGGADAQLALGVEEDDLPSCLIHVEHGGPLRGALLDGRDGVLGTPCRARAVQAPQVTGGFQGLGLSGLGCMLQGVQDLGCWVWGLGYRV